MVKVSYFTQPITSDFSVTSQGHLSKKALILVEGIHKDSKKRTHKFDAERIEKIAENTNALFEKGGRIPLLEDHNKSMGSTIGDLASTVEVREITEEDLPEGKFKHLIGKLGIFADQILIKSKRAIEQAQEDLLNTISAGVDVMDDVIREISVTPTPAIEGMRLFHRGDNANFALTWEQLEQSKENFEEVEEQLEELNKTFSELVENIYKADIEELEGYSHNDLLVQALQEYMMRVASVIGIEPEEEMEENESSPQQQANQIMQRQMGKGYPNTGFSNPKYVAAFSMSDMADFYWGQEALQSAGNWIKKQGMNKGFLDVDYTMLGKTGAKKRVFRDSMGKLTQDSSKARTILSDKGRKWKNYGIAGGVGLGGGYVGSKMFGKKQEVQERKPLFKSLF